MTGALKICLTNKIDSVRGPFTKPSVSKGATGYTEGGVGWYRKTFTLDKGYAGKQTYITFDGVYQDADVWINNHHRGYHTNWYTSFSLQHSYDWLHWSFLIYITLRRINKHSI